jgi:hypothetical protein
VSDDGKVWRLKRERDASSSRQPTIGKLPCYNIKKPRPNRRKYDVSWWATEEKSASPVDRNFSSQFIPSWKWGGGIFFSIFTISLFLIALIVIWVWAKKCFSSINSFPR